MRESGGLASLRRFVWAVPQLMVARVWALATRLLAGLGMARALGVARPTLRIGIVSDVQYADTEDATNFIGTRQRRYRHSLGILEKAVGYLDQLGDVAMAVQLGDMLDGKAASGGKESSRAALADVRRVLEAGRLGRTAGGWRACVGNHELYNFDRWELAREDLYFEGDPEPNLRRLVDTYGPAGDGFDADDISPPLYYSTRPQPGWRVVFLDAYAVSVIGDARGAWGRLEAGRFLNTHNPNVDPVDPSKPGNWLDGISGVGLRWVPYNGGLGGPQLQWLETELAAAQAAAERVLIFCHQPFHAPATRFNNLPWDYDRLHEVVAAAGATVAAVFAGHDHDGGYAVDAQGVHHCVPPAPLECDEGEVAYGHLDCFEDRIEMTWIGKWPLKTDVWPDVLPLGPLRKAASTAKL